MSLQTSLLATDSSDFADLKHFDQLAAFNTVDQGHATATAREMWHPLSNNLVESSCTGQIASNWILRANRFREWLQAQGHPSMSISRLQSALKARAHINGDA
jgi:hypothetical protein